MIAPVDRSAWEAFRLHHYLNTSLAPAAASRCVGGFVDGECVAFAAWMHFPHPTVKNIMKSHRVVVLPDWQGLGLGGAMVEWNGQHCYEQGYRFHVTTAHPAFQHYFQRSPRWRFLARGHGNGIRQIPRQFSSKDARSLRQRMVGSRVWALQTYAYAPPARSLSTSEEPGLAWVQPRQTASAAPGRRRRKRTRVR